jgi:peptide/nickel transport system permease protein
MIDPSRAEVVQGNAVPDTLSEPAIPLDVVGVASGEEWRALSRQQLIWRRFKRSRPAVIGAVIVLMFYTGALFAEFLAPYSLEKRFTDQIYSPPTRLHFFDTEGNFHMLPFVYARKQTVNRETLELSYAEDTGLRYPVSLFVQGEPYKMWGLIPMNWHLFGVAEGGTLFLLGSDRQGRDMFSRTLYGARISLSVGLIGVLISIVLGAVFGVISGYYGGLIDDGMQRFSELLLTIPQIPLWMALAAIVPVTWSPLRVYFGITIILSLLNWGGLARQVRGKTLALREEGYTRAALAAGASDWWVITRHLIPNNASHIIVIATLAIPYMILGETALSFLGLGIRAPMTSWGVLLQEAQNVKSIVFHPWLIAPAVLVIVAVIGFNFLGDGMRDAVDPYSR